LAGLVKSGKSRLVPIIDEKLRGRPYRGKDPSIVLKKLENA